MVDIFVFGGGVVKEGCFCFCFCFCFSFVKEKVIDLE